MKPGRVAMWAVAALVLLPVGALGWGYCFLSTVSVPSEGAVISWGQEFLVLEPDVPDVCGIYMNIDVPSIVFDYRTDATDREQFVTRLVASAGRADWQRVADLGPILRFQRSVSREGPQEARVVLNPGTGRVTVAIAAATQSGGLGAFDQGDDKVWFDRNVWSLLPAK